MIDDRAIIHPTAKLAKGVIVSPGAVIGANVEIGESTWIGPYAVIEGPTTIGKNNKIFQFASVGDEPQDITYKGEPTRLEIGDNNIIREYCMISRGTIKGGGVTRIGNNNFLMAYAHIGHDCMLGNNIIMINYGALSGHVTVHDYAIIGGYAAVHQFCHVGAYAFIARATYAAKDVLPYIMVAGYNSSVYGINSVGLRRRGFSSETINSLRRAYKIIFRKGLTVQQAVAELELMQIECPEIMPMIDALNKSARGIVR
ncbi:acyl-ACP--UDP-N-acetylglucosamine O-acyltransferase [Legionella sp.]|uniref:acyl-ACP--UDP-N-acetylglucosamine O-acyltransferase n=1 Tax=Legionella sp. TaxID=459 RepID=UPI003CBD17E4